MFDTFFYLKKLLEILGFLTFIYWAYYIYALTRLRGAKNIADVATVGAGKPAADRSDRTLIGAGQLVSADSCVRLAPQGTPAEIGAGAVEPNMESKLPTHRLEGTLI